ncbi:MAG: type III secretion system effector protein [Paludibacteraceae bacterium]|nr:type III secretion system effector protein [Paludibacteraceae bacterium]
MDPTGKKLFFAKGCSPQFKRAFGQAIKYMNSKKTSGIFYRLQKSSSIIYISMATFVDQNGNYNYEYENRFNPNTNTIYWNPLKSLKWQLENSQNNESILLSPETMLFHEATHAEHFVTDPDQYKKDTIEDPTNPYQTVEEQKTIKAETQAAVKHGDIKSENDGRKNHNGEYVDSTKNTKYSNDNNEK